MSPLLHPQFVSEVDSLEPPRLGPGRPHRSNRLKFDRAGTIHVLVVDDQKELNDIISQVLEIFEFKVSQAESALDAINLWHQENRRIDLVLTDVIMPVNTGFDLADAILEEKPDQDIVFMSGYDPKTLETRFDLEEGRNFILKPFAMKELLQVLSARFSAV